jgi:hypothetical protein
MSDARLYYSSELCIEGVDHGVTPRVAPSTRLYTIDSWQAEDAQAAEPLGIPQLRQHHQHAWPIGTTEDADRDPAPSVPPSPEASPILPN